MKWRIHAARVCIGVVTFFNLQAAIIFLINPAAYSGGFELSGVSGAMLVRGMGILFVMWNVPYIVALLNPIRYKVSLVEAIVMQSIGVIGEIILLATLPAGHNALRLTAARFIAFDTGGLILLILAYLMTIRISDSSHD